MKRLSDSELKLLEQLIAKMDGRTDDDIYGDNYSSIDYSRRVRRKVQVDDLGYDDDGDDEPQKEIVYRKKGDIFQGSARSPRSDQLWR